MPDLDVRSIRKDELVQLLDLYGQLHSDDPQLPLDANLAALWDQIVSDPKLLYFVGDLDGTLVASCSLTLVPNLTRGARPYGLIENVITHVDYRKRGFGTKLLRHALGVAWEHDCYKVMLLTGHKDEAVLRFYERAGFLRGIKTGFIAYPINE
jgi:ribosomal protein S18 acetylase RimI-like enzyme